MFGGYGTMGSRVEGVYAYPEHGIVDKTQAKTGSTGARVAVERLHVSAMKGTDRPDASVWICHPKETGMIDHQAVAVQLRPLSRASVSCQKRTAWAPNGHVETVIACSAPPLHSFAASWHGIGRQ